MNSKVQGIATAVLLLGAVIALFLFGVFGIGRTSHSIAVNQDGQVLYAAGRAWLNGSNPYNYVDFSRTVARVSELDINSQRFFYPPQAAALCVVLGALPYPVARRVWLLCNLFAVGILAFLISVMMAHDRGGTGDRFGPWIVAAVVIGNPFTSQVIWMGQTTLVAFAATLAAWHFSRRRRWITAGLCLGLASIKPQLCVLVAFWLFLERDWKALAAAALSVIILASYPIVTQGAIQSFSAWHAGVVEGYAAPSAPFNLPSWGHKVGLESLLYAFGVSTPGWVWLGIALLLAAIQWRYRKYVDSGDWLGLLMANGLLFSTFVHDYDYAALVPIYPSIWRYALNYGGVVAVSDLLLVLLLFVPMQFMRLSQFPIFTQWRTVVIFILAAMIVIFNVREARGKHRPGASHDGHAGVAH